MQALWQRFGRLPRWGQWTIGILILLLLISLVMPSDDSSDDTAATTTVTVPTPPPADTDTTPAEPEETLADAQEAIESNQYDKALVIAGALGEEDVIRRRIANQIARRVTTAVSAGDRSRASSLLHQADSYPATSALTQARATYRTAKQRAAERARLREAAAERAAAEERAEEEAAAAEPERDSQSSGCDPGYSGCVPAYPPDVNCPDVSGPVQVTGSDPHGLDRDGDGVACE